MRQEFPRNFSREMSKNRFDLEDDPHPRLNDIPVEIACKLATLNQPVKTEGIVGRLKVIKYFHRLLFYLLTDTNVNITIIVLFTLFYNSCCWKPFARKKQQEEIELKGDGSLSEVM